MIKNYLKIALRNLIRHKAYSAINVAGLAIGITCCFLIISYVMNELQFEKFHEHKDHIYRVTTEVNFGGQNNHLAMSLTPLVPLIRNEIPEVMNAVRIRPTSKAVVSIGTQHFTEEKFFFADSNLFEIFTFPLVSGNPKSVLAQPFSVLISEEIAYKYFGDEDPIGEVLTYENQHDFTITGVMQDVPQNTQLHADFFADFGSLYEIQGEEMRQWGAISPVYSYLLLSPNANPSDVKDKITALFSNHAGEMMASIFTLHLQPFQSIYLHSNLMAELEPSGDIGYIYLFSTIAALILLIACINFMNLTTARSMHRAKEVGMRKTLGAQRSQLVSQFLGESIVVSFLAVILAAILYEISLPFISDFSGKNLGSDLWVNFWIIPGLVGIVLVVGLIAGSYPAFFLSKFQPVRILYGGMVSGSSRSLLRRLLVVFQFSISIALIVATAVIFSQLDYVRHKDLGFNKEHVVLLSLDNPILRQQYQPLKRELLTNPNIVNVTGTFTAPGSRTMRKIGVIAEGIPEEETPPMQSISVDYDYITTLGLEIVQGREFSEEMSTDADQAYILNQTAVNMLGWTDPIGKKFYQPSEYEEDVQEGQVIGVVKDFHTRSLHEKIEPIFLNIEPELYRILAIRIRPKDVAATLDFIENTWGKFNILAPFEYTFVDESFAEQYRSDERLSQIFIAFSLLAVFIGCLGLFGLTAFAAERRTKEIGIRKVLGASIANIVGLLSKEFVILVIAANVIAWPIAYYGMNKWLENFAYHVDMSVFTFVMAAAIALAIAVGTMSFQAIRAALSNPVNALRYE